MGRYEIAVIHLKIWTPFSYEKMYVTEIFTLTFYSFMPSRGKIIYAFAIELWVSGLYKVYEVILYRFRWTIFFLQENDRMA